MPRLFNRKKAAEASPDLSKNKGFIRSYTQLNDILGQANLNLYGTDRTSDIDKLNAQFQSILKDEMGELTNNNTGDVTSFLNRLWSNDRKDFAYNDMMEELMGSGVMGEDVSSMSSFIFEAYRNRMVEQSDLHQVASQLVELSEAILITRDSIVSADVVEGRMSRTLKFNDIAKDEESDAIPIVERVEEKFGLLDKIKNFIIPKTLEYGEYYAYIIPYAKIFNDFMKKQMKNGPKPMKRSVYREFTLVESIEESLEKTGNTLKKKQFINECYTAYCEACKLESEDKPGGYIQPNKEAFSKDVYRLLDHVTISNDPVPIPVVEEGYYTVEEYMKEFVTESGTNTYTEAKGKEEKTNQKNLFQDVNNGVYFANKKTGEDTTRKKDDFSDIRDCYVKLYSPTNVIPVELMNKVIGYYVILDEDVTPTHGMVSSELGYSKFDDRLKEHTVLNVIVDKLIDAFDKNFLKENEKFKEMIVEAINFYNLNEKRIKFQFVPAEYMQVFKIDADENGHGQSMLKKSLFYAKLYLMLLLFKIMSIILYSNDQRVNYIKTSGISKNIANKVQEIARIKQSRQINMMDLFSYTTLINKIGSGLEMYIPVGAGGADSRPIETEILSGQDVQLNTELLEMLKNAYIMATGVPAAIINYLNEADFAKQIEQNNTKYNGRVVNYQLDFNPSITEMYKRILRWSTNLSDATIENFEFQLQPPKQTSNNAKAENVEGFDRVFNFIAGLFFDNAESPEVGSDAAKEIKEFKKLYAADQLPMINVDKIEELIKQAKINVKQKKLEPNPNNGDDGDDIGLDDDMGGLGL